MRELEDIALEVAQNETEGKTLTSMNGPQRAVGQLSWPNILEAGALKERTDRRAEKYWKK